MRYTLVKKLPKIKVARVLKENSIIGWIWSSAKLFIAQNYSENLNGDVLLTVENVYCFQFL